MIPLLGFCLLFLPGAIAASACSTSLTPTNSIKPSVASGYDVALVATGLAKPRSLLFDTLGNLLTVQQGVGIVNLQLQDDGGTCLGVKSSRTVISNRDLNHGLALSQDGKTIYASSVDAAWSWTYDPENASVDGSNITLVTGMANEDHVTRTLLLSKKVNNTLLVSRGSDSNIDSLADSISSGHAQVKAFNLANVPDGGYNFTTDGEIIGWGLRNSVGLVEHPDTGGIFSVENSGDELVRDGKDIHEENPGEEMNFLGFLNGTGYDRQGSNYGYPNCFAAWGVDDLPNNADLRVGSQYALKQTDKINDAYCAEQTPPILTFQAHMAPLDIKFNNSATEAWITFHGSWDRTHPAGYKLSMVPFKDGNPIAKPDNNTAALDVLANADNSVCPQNCLRPVGIAFDTLGRLFLSSDATDEIYVVIRAQASTPADNSTESTSSSDKDSSGTAIEQNMRFFATMGLFASLVSLAVL